MSKAPRITMVTYPLAMDASLQKLNRVVYGMERRGVPIDLGILNDIASKARVDANASRSWLDSYVGEKTGRLPAEANWGYAKWLADVLHNRPAEGGLGIPPSPYFAKGRTKPGQRVTDSRAIEWMASTNPEHRDFLNNVRTYRRQQRMENYALTWIGLAIPHPDGTNRLHPSFGMGSDNDSRPGAKTGRFGIKNPALQQVPRDKRKDPYGLRRAFVAGPGQVLLVADYSQLEVVILAHLCVRLFGTRILADRLLPGKPDLHSATAAYVFGQILGQPGILSIPVDQIKKSPEWSRFRDLIKAVRYGLNYLKGEYGFGNGLFETDSNGEICGPAIGEAKAHGLIEGLKAFDPEIATYQEWTLEYITKYKAMPTLAGRWLPLPEMSGDKWQQKRAHRRAVNVPMQGGGQEITAEAMIRLEQAGFEMTLQCHDEIHCLVDDDKADIAKGEMKRIMEAAWPLEAYLKAEVGYGKSWYDAK